MQCVHPKVKFPGVKKNVTLGQGWQTFSRKGQRVNISDFAGHPVSVAMTQLYCFSAKWPQAICEWMSRAVFQ